MLLVRPVKVASTVVSEFPVTEVGVVASTVEGLEVAPHLKEMDVVGSDLAFTVPTNFTEVEPRFAPVGADVVAVGAPMRVKFRMLP